MVFHLIKKYGPEIRKGISIKVIWDDNRTNLNDPEYNLFMLTNGQFVPK